jgi:hypothetical protein
VNQVLRLFSDFCQKKGLFPVILEMSWFFLFFQKFYDGCMNVRQKNKEGRKREKRHKIYTDSPSNIDPFTPREVFHYMRILVTRESHPKASLIKSQYNTR